MIKKSFLIFLIMLAAAPLTFGAAVLEIGSPVPPLVLKTVDAKPFDFEKEINNLPVLITFFTSWSRSAQQQVAALQSLKDAYKEKIKVIAVALDRKEAELNAFLDENKVSLTVLRDPKLKALKDYRVLIIPTTFLIDQNGNLSRIYVDFDDNIKEALSRDVSRITRNAEPPLDQD